MRRRGVIPPWWFSLFLIALGIYGTSRVYLALTTGAWFFGLIGLAILLTTVTLLGIPLAYARHLMSLSKQSRLNR